MFASPRAEREFGYPQCLTFVTTRRTKRSIFKISLLTLFASELSSCRRSRSRSGTTSKPVGGSCCTWCKSEKCKNLLSKAQMRNSMIATAHRTVLIGQRLHLTIISSPQPTSMRTIRNKRKLDNLRCWRHGSNSGSKMLRCNEIWSQSSLEAKKSTVFGTFCRGIQKKGFTRVRGPLLVFFFVCMR